MKDTNKAQPENEVFPHPVPEHILIAAKDLCEYMPPSALAELVDYWCDGPDTLPLAQIALDAGVRNCGLNGLAGYLTHTTDYCVDEERFIAAWVKAGLITNRSVATGVEGRPTELRGAQQ